LSENKLFGDSLKEARKLLGNRLALDVDDYYKDKGKFSVERFVSTTASKEMGIRHSMYRDISWGHPVEGTIRSGSQPIPKVVVRYSGIKKGIGVSPLSAKGFEHELEVVIGAGNNTIKYSGSEYDEDDQTIYIDFGAVN
jgi:hypothetical protein